MAEEGKILIVTSALTLTEVIWAKGHDKLDPSTREQITEFFVAPYISVRNVTRRIAERARDIVWDNEIRPKDAIHVATALDCEVPVLNTFDKKLLSRDKQVGTPPLRIEEPHYPGQQNLV